MTSEKPSFHIWLASVLRQNKVAYAPIDTDPAGPRGERWFVFV